MKTALLLVSLLAIWPFSGGKEYRMTADSTVPAASGTVQVQTDKDNGNMKLDIKVNHLAHPSTLTPSENTYIVWVRANGGEAVKQGAIGVDNNLKGELKVVTTSKDFNVFITAEQSDSVVAPSGVRLLQTHVGP